MRIEPFALERFFARHEHGADIMLAESGIRSLSADRFDTDPGTLGYVIPTDGDPDLRADVAARYGRGPDEVVFTCGTQEANFLVFAALVDADAHAVVVTPTYQALRSVPAAFGDVTTVELSPPDWTLDVEAVKAAVRPETELVVLVNPNNPTGRYHDEATVRALYEIVADAGAYLHCDEVYRLLADEPLPPVASMGPRGISTTSLTKSYGLAGARFGWIAGPRDVVEAAVVWKDYTTISPPIFGQHVARQALGEREAAILAENRALAAENRAVVAGVLDEHGLEWHEPVGVNGFVSIPDAFDSGRSFCERFVAEESVVLAPGDAFGFPGYVRIGFGLETPELEEGLARLGSFLDRHA